MWSDVVDLWEYVAFLASLLIIQGRRVNHEQELPGLGEFPPSPTERLPTRTHTDVLLGLRKRPRRIIAESLEQVAPGQKHGPVDAGMRTDDLEVAAAKTPETSRALWTC